MIVVICHNYNTNLQVQMNFLPVGHTHEDVDQLFSKIGEKIRKSGSESIPGMHLHYVSQTT